MATGGGGGGDLENSAGGPTSKEGCPFIVDFVLKEFAWCALPISVSLPPTHFHLKTQNRDETLEDNSPPHLHDSLKRSHHTHTRTHLSMYVPAEAGGETLYMKSDAALVGQTLEEVFGPFIISLILLFFPIAACQHHHVTLQTSS